MYYIENPMYLAGFSIYLAAAATSDVAETESDADSATSGIKKRHPPKTDA